MPDSQTPQENDPERIPPARPARPAIPASGHGAAGPDGAGAPGAPTGSGASGSGGGAPRPAAATVIPSARPAAPNGGPAAANGNGAGTGAQAPTASSGKRWSPARIQLLDNHKLVWAVVALVCAAAGAVTSVVGAHAVARNDATAARQSAQQTSAAIASTVKLSLRHEEDIAVGAATYFAGNSKTSPKEFATWVKWARTLRRYPELDGLSLVTLVHASELAAFDGRITGQAVKRVPTSTATIASSPATPSPTSTTSPATPARPALRVVPATDHGYYCLAIANLVRGPAKSPPAGLDYCAVTPGLLLSRDSGLSSYTTVLAGGSKALAIDVPVYRGNATPHTVFGRDAASVGWLREVLNPAVVLREALRGHEASAVRLSYNAGATHLAFADGTTPSGVQSSTTELRNGGWTVQSFAAPPSTSVLGDGSALALLIVGCVLSGLAGVLIFVLGPGREPGEQREPVRMPVPQPRKTPAEELHDPLTSLPNRALMMDRAECMLARAGRQSGLLVGALFIDVDWFKDVNERLGEAAGDQILKIVAERLEGVVRAGDTVGRLGDDEFVLLVETAARGARLDSLARRVVEALHKPFELDGFGPSFFLTASIGVAFGRYETPEDLLRDAQLALFAAKSAGKDRYTLFNANMRSVIEGRGVLEQELNAALAEKQFFLLYEPIYDLSTGKVAGLEALIRWLHPKRGVVLPDDFIPLAEETGLTVPIGRWALEEACGRAAAWNVAGFGVGVSVEVTANQLNRENFVTDVRRALQQSGVEPSMLTLEIPETTVMSDVNAAVERLQEIKQLGVRIAIDDFGGSGYAYHSDLRRLPLDFLKVDRASLAASEDEDYRTWLLEAILIVGRDLSLTVIAKGIESFDQIAALQEMGCTMAQGAMMGKPVPANALEKVFGASLPTVRAE
ncbi:MAG TPA: EAL domain-containing protein [Solirubrobacteraceae bacterium]|jgi:diguanylate cyclase (GGDEF)-like protein|nr:EAL domain-containing protein [Solirubrobacteraceae bacterium]